MELRRLGHGGLQVSTLSFGTMTFAGEGRYEAMGVAQVAINWLLSKPGVDSVIVGARNELQLRDNLAAATWRLTADEIQRQDETSLTPEPYPYWHQHKWGLERNPRSVNVRPDWTAYSAGAK